MTRTFLAFDTETPPITPEDPNPRLVCLSWYAPGFWRGDAGLVDRDEAPAAFFDLCVYSLMTRATLIAHNTPFDLGVILRVAPELTALVYFMLDEGLIEDSLIREMLWSIARGDFTSENGVRGRYVERDFRSFSLADSCLVRRGWYVAKEDTWRLRYGELLGVPIDQWPVEARTYPLEDALWVWRLAQAQEEDETTAPVRQGHYAYGNSPAQMRAAWALALCRIRGIWTEKAVADQVAADIERRLTEELGDLIKEGLVRPPKWRPKKKEWKRPEKNTKAIEERVVAVYQRLGREAPRNAPTEKAEEYARVWGTVPEGSVKKDKLALETAGVHDDVLMKLLRYNVADKLRGFGRALQNGHIRPIHSEPNVLVETGRTSWRGPNLQQLPKESDTWREAFIPNAGFYLASIDYNQLELCSLAQTCIWTLGASKMAELINAGMDLHCALAAQYLGITYEDFTARYKAKDKEAKILRQFAKEGNFGFPGGMGPERFIDSAMAKPYLREIRHLFTLESVTRLRRAWMATFPEIPPYFDIASRISQHSRQDVQLASGRIRGKLGFCDAANGKFQGLAADGAKDALYALTRAMWAEPASVLFGSRMLIFVHDEYVFEVPVDRAHEAVHAAYDIAMGRMSKWLPDIKVKGSMALMRRWRKEADEYRDETGRLQPCEMAPGFKARIA